MSASSARVNLSVPLDMMIQIEKFCDRRGLTRVQFIREAIHEKLRKNPDAQGEDELKNIREDIHELKKIVLLISGK